MRICGIACLAIALILAGSTTSGQEPPSRVIFITWDGAGYWMTSRLLAEGRLPHLQRLVREGSWSDGMVSSFPTKTAAAHAMLYTGTYGHTNGITGNLMLLEPASEHNRLERRPGYPSDGLKGEPIWVTTARAGLMTYTFHATQSYPFEKHLERVGPGGRKKLRVLYGYSQMNVLAEVFSEKETSTTPAWGWSIPEARGAEAREFQFEVGDDRFWGVFYDDPIDPPQGCDTLGIVGNKRDTVFAARVKPGEDGSFSEHVGASLGSEELWFSLRLFELDRTASRFLLYRSSAQAVILSSDDFPGAGEMAVEAYAGNGGASIYRAGGFGTRLPEGGSGIAEDRFLETEAHLTDQIGQQAERVLSEGDYRLLVMYTPVIDDVAHALMGHLDPLVPWYDEALAARLWPKLVAAYELQDRLLGLLMDHAEKDGAHIVLASDHGMAGTSRRLNVNIALERAGLLALTPERLIDLSRTRALLLPIEDASVAVNTEDRKGGIVPLEQKAAVMAEVRKALERVEDPETGEPVVKGFFESSRTGLLQPGGETTGDLFLDLVPGYYFSAATEKDELVTKTAPEGNHIFLPTRRDMLAICGAWGTRVVAGEAWPRVRALDVVPTLLDILRLHPLMELPGRSLLPQTPLIDSR